MIRINADQSTELLFFKMKMIRIFAHRRYLVFDAPFGKPFSIIFCADPQIIRNNFCFCFFCNDKTCQSCSASQIEDYIIRNEL